MARGNQRDKAREKNASKNDEKGRKDDGLTPMQRKERFAFNSQVLEMQQR